MTPTETAAFLRRYNKWRRDDEDISQFDVCKISEAIDAAVEMIERLEAAEWSDAESIAMYRKARDERDALRVEIEEMEKQPPICRVKDLRRARYMTKVVGLDPDAWLYALPGAKGEEK